MAVERTEAVVLKSVDFSETSRIVTFLCPERGRLVCMAAGARRPKSKLAGALDTFNIVELVYYWKDGRSVQKLAEATLLDGLHDVKRNLEKGQYASVPIEFAYRVAHENEPSHALYDSLRLGMTSLASWMGDVRTHCCWQMLHMLAAAGYEPSTEVETQGDKVPFSYAVGLSGAHEKRDVYLSRESCGALALLSHDRTVCPDVKVSREVFKALCKFAEHHLETGLRSVRVVEEIF